MNDVLGGAIAAAFSTALLELAGCSCVEAATTVLQLSEQMLPFLRAGLEVASVETRDEAVNTYLVAVREEFRENIAAIERAAEAARLERGDLAEAAYTAWLGVDPSPGEVRPSRRGSQRSSPTPTTGNPVVDAITRIFESLDSDFTALRTTSSRLLSCLFSDECDSVVPREEMKAVARASRPAFDDALLEVHGLQPRTSEERELVAAVDKGLDAWIQHLEAMLEFDELDDESLIAFDETALATTRTLRLRSAAQPS